ncbi:Uma2 family endonuclease [Nostoc sp. FACHB-973]|uniref:Uma2 family endonuclease n=1 Tax=Desmonostoc muscorum LEGE 12446 TaxID=1828758 RepID=A0A8J7D3L6_DESMC|nr:Uma2 family endonuclease [Desmonostoc muscorum]MBD2515991.1 Uma2 family endonuclease [Nostoc sp. FACHB-973]MCF2151576.1 Uma2 family endonuclease [Desmonostoc muscorum LEGE 12446]
MTATTSQNLSNELAERGWRTEIVTQPDGSIDYVQIPLTSEEFLHPQEGYHLPNSTFHDDAAGDVKDMLTRRYANDSTTGVFRDLIIKWGILNLKNHCPDTFVVFGIQNKQQNRTEFVVSEEGVRPSLIIEVVSPRYRKEDRQTKVKHYAEAGVQEYLIIDRRRQREQVIEEVLGYRLVDGQYLPLTPDEEGRILCETVGLLIGLQDGRVIMEDAQTGERLLTSLELEQRASQAEQRANQAEQRANQAEQRAARLAELLKAQGINPDQI